MVKATRTQKTVALMPVTPHTPDHDPEDFRTHVAMSILLRGEWRGFFLVCYFPDGLMRVYKRTYRLDGERGTITIERCPEEET